MTATITSALPASVSSSTPKTGARWIVAGCLAAVVAALAIVHMPKRETTTPESMKVEVDAVTRATPRRLAAPLEITDVETYEALHFDPRRQDHGNFSYRLSKPAWIRVKAPNSPIYFEESSGSLW